MSVPDPGTVSQLPAAPQPTWEVAELFPTQGAWSEQEYLDFETNRLVEFSDGAIEVLNVPTEIFAAGDER